MNETGNQFRTTAFGGFNKQDVLEYITRTARDHREQSDSLKRSLETIREERDQLTQKLSAAERERAEKTDACAQLTQTLEQRTLRLETAEQELAQLRADYEKAAARLAELEQKLPALEEDAAAYSVLKDHTATIELEAHRKAQETVERAQCQAARTRSELENWVRRVQSGYQLLRRDLQATVSHLSGELERGCRALEDSGEAFAQHDKALAALLECQQCPVAPGAPEDAAAEEDVQADG